MEWIVNNENSYSKFILFRWRDRNWEIVVDANIGPGLTSDYVATRIAQLEKEEIQFGGLDNSDLVYDLTEMTQQHRKYLLENGN